MGQSALELAGGELPGDPIFILNFTLFWGSVRIASGLVRRCKFESAGSGFIADGSSFHTGEWSLDLSYTLALPTSRVLTFVTEDTPLLSPTAG